MKKIYSTFLLLCLGLSLSFAQENLVISVTPDEVEIDAGEEITLDVEVANFNDLLSMQFNINWDPSVLEYVSTNDILSNQDLPGFTEAGSIGNTEANTEAGRVSVVWLDFATFQAYSLPDNTVLFSITLRALEDGDGSITLDNFEVFDGQENSIEVTANESSITVGEGGGGGANNDPVEVTVGDASGDSGAQVCLPIRVSNFEDMQTMQFSMAYDNALLEFAQVQNFGLSDLAAGNFGTQTDGELTFSWNSGDDATSLGNNTRIFDICFDLIGTEDATTDVTIENTPLAEEAMRADIGEVGIDATDGTVTIQGENNGGGGTSDEFRIYASEASGGTGAEVCVDVQVDGFMRILGMQYTMQWDSDVIEFTELRSLSTDLSGLSMQNFGLENTDNGELRLQWNDFSSADGVTLPDETTIYQICFDIVGTAGQGSDVAFTNTPVNQEVINADNQEVPFLSDNGRVRVTGDPPPPSDCDANATPFCVSNETAGVGENVCVSVTAQNFEDLVGVQFTLTFDESITRFDRIVIPEDNPMNLNLDANFNPQNTAGIIAFRWDDPLFEGVSIEDDTELFQVCFDTRNEGISPIGFAETPIAIEVLRVVDNDVQEVVFSAGSGQIEVSDGCAAPSVSGEVLDVACAGEESGAISLTVEGGNNNFSFDWGALINRDTPNPTGLPAGEYTVTVSFADGSCAATTEMTFMIEESGDPLQAEAMVTGEVLCAGEDNEVSIEINVQGGDGDYSFRWQGPSEAGNLNGRMNSNLPAGEYDVQITDGNGCESTLRGIEVEGPTEVLTAQVNYGCDDENGAIRLNVTGGTEDYSFEWNEGLNDSDTQTGLEIGTTYSVTVTDANDCEFINEEIEIFEPLALGDPSFSFIVDNDGGVDINVMGGSSDFSFAWSGPDFTSEEEDIAGLGTEGVYMVTVTDNVTGCEVSDSYEVLMNTAIGIVNIMTTPDCSGEDGNSGTIFVEVTGGVPPLTYLWNTGDTTKDLITANAGVGYLLTITDSRGDTFEMTEPIIVGSAPAINFNLLTEPETCGGNSNNGSIMLTTTGGTGAINWDWSIEGNANQSMIEGLSSGDVTVTITDNGGCMIIRTANIEYQPEAPRATDFEITEADCGSTNGAIAFSVTCGDPGYTVMIRGRNPENDTTYMFQFEDYDPRVSLENLLPDTYDVTISDANEGSTPEVITVPAPGSMDVVGTVLSSTQVFAPCDGEVRLNLPMGSTNNYQFLWNDGDTTRNRTQLCEGTYMVTITNPQGCTQIDSFVIETFNANGIVNNPECSQGDPTGSIELTVTAGQGPYTYMWMNQAGEMLSDSQRIVDIEAGIYTVKITESSGVSISRTFEVVGSIDLAAQVSFLRDYGGFGVSCNGAEDAMLQVVGTSSVDTAMYEYKWLSKEKMVMLSDSATLVDVGPDIYEVEVTALGCTVTQSIVVAEPDVFEVFPMEVLDAACEADGEIILETSGGGGDPYTYEWSHNANNNFATANNLAGGSYSYTVTDGNGCVASDSTTIRGGISISVEFETIPISANKGGTITANITGGTPEYQYRWLDPSDMIIPDAMDSVLQASNQGTYMLMVEDINGCTTTAEVNLINEDGCLETRPVITPNGDGKNENFIIRCVESYKDQSIEIYNRWGTLVFRTADYDSSWMGQNMDGEPVPDGVYYYVLFYRDFNDEEKQQTGTVTVLTE
ncbi:MAG: cohesin domain-containing protein [Bacteroidota bacterium]